MYLLDTNVLSEPNRPRPDDNVSAWLEQTRAESTFTAATVVAEMLFGAATHPDPVRRNRLHQNIEFMLQGRVAGRVLPYDLAAARVHARLLAVTRSRQRPRPDLQIAAVALVHNLTLVTRNIRDFTDLGVPLLDPWSP
jgi:hypothetical protein